MQVSVAQAKKKLTELIKAVEGGESVTICRRGVPVADLVRTLRKAAKEGFDQIDRGEGIEFQSMEELDKEIDRLGREVSAELVSARKHA